MYLSIMGLFMDMSYFSLISMSIIVNQLILSGSKLIIIVIFM